MKRLLSTRSRRVSACLLGVLVALELGLRLLGGAPLPRVVADEELGWRWAPHQTALGERGVRLETNALGFRDREWPAPRPDDPTRVAVLGDSLTFAEGEPVDHGWTRACERALNRAGRPAHVLNLSVPGYTLRQLEVLQRRVVPQLGADVLVIAVGPHAARPDIRTVGGEGLPLRDALGRSRLWCRLERALHLAPVQAMEARDLEGLDDDHRMRVDHGSERLLAALETPGDPLGEALWQEAGARLQRMAERAREAGQPLLLVSLPVFRGLADPVHGTRLEERWRTLAEAAGVPFLGLREELARPTEPLLREVRAQGLDPLAVWRRGRARPAALSDPSDSPFRVTDPAHLTQLGHGLVGERVATELLEREVLP